MKQKVLSTLLLLSIIMTGCGSKDAGNSKALESSEAGNETEQVVEAEAGNETEQVMETEDSSDIVEYSHKELYLSVEIPEGWEYEIITAEEMAKKDEYTTCAINFWSTEYPDTIFELSHKSAFGLCGTGVDIQEFTLDNGLTGFRYTEKMEDTLWMNITLDNPYDDTYDGTYVISASPRTTVWDALEPEFEQILKTVRVGLLGVE